MAPFTETRLAQSSTSKVSFRAIEAADLPAIMDLLQAGFPKRNRRYWEMGLSRLARHVPPDGFPQFGFMLRTRDRPVGMHLMISSIMPGQLDGTVRSNGSCWYVEEAFRSYGVVLLMRATRRQPAVYINIDPRPATLPIIEAQGFRKFSQGVFAALPLFARVRTPPMRLLSHDAGWKTAGIPAADLRLLRDHAAFGCLALWCETATGGQPLIVRRRLVKPGVPAAQLIYCQSLEDLEAIASPVGRFLAAHGMPMLLVAADCPLRGVPGRFFAEKFAMYAKGAKTPRIGDLSYTEAAVFGL